MKITKRFIAGAVCSKCKLIDKIVLIKQDGNEYIECVHCGQKMQQPGVAVGEKKLKSIPIMVKSKERK